VQATEQVHPRMIVAIAVHATALATLAAPAIVGPAIAAAAVVAAAPRVAVATLRFAAFEYPVFATDVVASVLVAFAGTFVLTGIVVAAAAAAVMSLAETLVGLWRSADPKHLECQVDNKYLVKCRTDTLGPSSRHRLLQKISLCPLSA